MPLILKVLEPHWRTKNETMSRVRGRIEAVLDFSSVRGYRAAGDNPARWSGWLSHALPAPGAIQKEVHHPALPFAEVPAFMAALAERDGVAARALELTILTASRTSETAQARWSEVDMAAKLWTVPAERMKSRRPHRVPLSPRALAVLAVLPREAGGYLFPGTRKGDPISNMAMLALLKRMKRDDITVHGFRSSFRDWISENTNHANVVAEAALAHVIGDKVESAYRRGDMLAKRARLMNDWARFCSTPLPDTATVTPISAGRRA